MKNAKIVKSVVQYANVLPKEVNRNLYQYAISKESIFRDTGGDNYTTIEMYKDWRKSKVLFHWDFKEFIAEFEKVIRNNFEQVCNCLQVEPFPIHDLELQLTSHNDGEYFKLHRDNDKTTQQTHHRMITFVYYFHSRVRKFEGGELALPENGKLLIEPVNNSMVYFNPVHPHEVLPVICKDKKFKNGRFSINGWIRRKPYPDNSPKADVKNKKNAIS